MCLGLNADSLQLQRNFAMGWLNSKSVQRLGGGFLERLGIRSWSKLMLAALAARKEQPALKLIRQIFRENRSLMTSYEMWIIYSLTRAQLKMPGAIAEVGVYKGASAKIICELKGDKPLHLFDTFAGLPKASAHDRGIHHEGQYTCCLEDVQDYLKDYSNLHYYQGLFPDSAINVSDDRFCLAHFDVDLYEGTKACLEYFYPRMVPGGIMITHDFDILVGVRKAFEDFLADKPESLIEMPTTQCMIVKLP
jgi:O-methyltransferase